MTNAPPKPLLFRWAWRKRLPERHGKLCRVLARGKLNSVLVEFLDDGAQVVASRYAVRRVEPSLGSERQERSPGVEQPDGRTEVYEL